MHTTHTFTKILKTLPAMAIMLLAGCVQHDLAEKTIPAGGITIIASADDYNQPKTRTVIGTSSSSDVLVMNWAVGEELGAFGSNDVNVKFTSTNTTTASTATFTSSDATEVPQYAYYPYALNVSDMTEIPVTIPQEQVYANASSLSAYDFKLATGVKEMEDGTCKMAFRQMGSLLKINIDLDGLAGLEAKDGETIESITFEHDAAVLWGDFTADATAPEKGLTPVSSDEDGVIPSVTITLEETPSVSEAYVAYAVVSPADVSGGVWYFTITTSEHEIWFIAETATDELEAGAYYTVPLTASVIDSRGYHYDENDQVVYGADIISFDEDGEDTGDDNEDPITPAGETANCYMISVASTYSFDASVMGNGDDGIIADAGFHTTSAAIEGGASAELLWQDTQSFITAVSYDSVSKTISYTASDNVGNACIALKGSDGTILWSWHIWGTGDREVQDDVYTNQAGSTFTVMDRNLGQLTMLYASDLHIPGEPMYVKESSGIYSSAAEAVDPIYCTLYQWGRKDPVPSAGTRYDINNNPTDISASYPVLNYNNFSSADEATIGYSIQNPDYLIDTYKYTSNQLWEKDGNAYLWGGGASTTYVQYMDNTAAVAGWENGKTIYDPCPVGYRVANPYTWTGFVGGTAQNGTGRDGTISLSNAPASTYVDYNQDGVFGDDEKLTPWDTVNDVAIVDGEEQLKQDLRAIVSFYETEGTSTRWVVRNGDYLLSSEEGAEGAVECSYVTRYYAPVYCQGLFFMADDNDTEGTFYPMLSFRNGSNGAFNTSGLGYYWSSGQGGSAPSAYYLKLGAYTYKSSGNSLSIDVFDNRSGKRDALPVRCVRED